MVSMNLARHNLSLIQSPCLSRYYDSGWLVCLSCASDTHFLSLCAYPSFFQTSFVLSLQFYWVLKTPCSFKGWAFFFANVFLALPGSLQQHLWFLLMWDTGSFQSHWPLPHAFNFPSHPCLYCVFFLCSLVLFVWGDAFSWKTLPLAFAFLSSPDPQTFCQAALIWT